MDNLSDILTLSTKEYLQKRKIFNQYVKDGTMEKNQFQDCIDNPLKDMKFISENKRRQAKEDNSKFTKNEEDFKSDTSSPKDKFVIYETLKTKNNFEFSKEDDHKEEGLNNFYDNFKRLNQKRDILKKLRKEGYTFEDKLALFNMKYFDEEMDKRNEAKHNYTQNKMKIQEEKEKKKQNILKAMKNYKSKYGIDYKKRLNLFGDDDEELY
ncbi:MAG: hypothetical protein MJ252_22460 [archaeon]|nr:hypothetical protein [archaeon]